MQLNKNTDLKVFEIWVSKDEKESIDKNGKLDRLFAICNECGYKPVVFVSGDNDLINNTAQLIRRKHNDESAA